MVAQKITKDLEKRFLVYEWLYNTVKSVVSSLLHNDLLLSLKPINGVSGHVTTTPPPPKMTINIMSTAFPHYEYLRKVLTGSEKEN